MPIPEPVTTIALSAGIFTNLATDILKHQAQAIHNPKFASLLKQLGLRELDFGERIQKLVADALELYFTSYESYCIQGIVEFFKDTKVASGIANYVITGEPINEVELSGLLKNHLGGQTVAQLLLKKRNLDVAKVIPDFLACYHQILNKQLDNSDMAVVALVLKSHHETQIEFTQLRKQLSSYQDQLNLIQASVHSQSVLQSAIAQRLSQFEGSHPSSFLTPIPPEDNPPTPPRIYAPRRKLVDSILEQWTQVGWIAFVDGPGKGKTQLARDLAVTSQLKMKWISLQGQYSSNPESHLRQQMVSWLISLSSDKGFWQRYIEGNLSNLDIAIHIVEHISDMPILVIDDLPPSDLFSSLYSELDVFVSVFSRSKVKILTTSQFPLPPSFQTKYKVEVMCINPLEYDDFVDILKSVNAPDYALKPGFVGMLMADGITGGLPSLASVTIDWLKHKNWKLDGAGLDAILMGEPTETERQFGRNRILKMLADASKEFLYRLSILFNPFDRGLALKIASVAPPIQYPGESFERLTSPWLDKLNNGEYQVTPYLRSTGQDNLHVLVQKEVHELAAHYYLSKGTISIDQVSSIAGHFYAAGKYIDYANFLVDFMVNAIQDSKQAKYADQVTLVSRLFVGTEWPEALDLNWRIIFRTGQIKVRLLAGEDATELDIDLGKLIAEASVNNWWAVLFAHGNLGISLATLEKDKTAVLIQLQHAIGFVKMYRAVQSNPSKIVGETPTGARAQDILSGLPESIENLIWITALGLGGLSQLRSLLDAVRQMNRKERECLFGADLAIETLSHIFDKIWINEADKPAQVQDWNKVLDFLDEAREVGDLSGAFPIQVIQARVRSIIMADYLNTDYDDALRDLYSLPHTNQPTLSFLINYSIGNCLFLEQENFPTALRHMENAIETGCRDFSYLYLQSWQIVAVINSKLENWSEAEEKCRIAIRLAVSQPELARYERLEMKGELAWIYWSQGDKQKACRAIFGYVIGLVQCYYDPSSKRFRESFNKAAHSLGWFSAMAHSGSPPPATHSGEPYMDVFPGIFAIRNSKLGDYIQPLGFSRTLMLQQLALFADSVGLYRMAWKLYNLIDSMDEDSPNSILVSMRAMNNAHLAVQFGTLSLAIQWGIQSVNSLIIAHGMKQSAANLHNSQVTIEESLNFVDLNMRKTAERELLYTVFLPAFVKMMGENISFQQVSIKLDELEQAINDHGVSLYDLEHWQNVVGFFRQLISMWDGQSYIEEENLFIPEDHSFLRVLWILLGSKRKGLSPRERITIHFQAINYMTGYPDKSRYMWIGIGKFIHNYWYHFPGFNLRNPDRLKTDLREIPIDLGEKVAAKVILSVLPAVDATLSQADFTKFQELAQRGLY